MMGGGGGGAGAASGAHTVGVQGDGRASARGSTKAWGTWGPPTRPGATPWKGTDGFSATTSSSSSDRASVPVNSGARGCAGAGGSAGALLTCANGSVLARGGSAGAPLACANGSVVTRG